MRGMQTSKRPPARQGYKETLVQFTVLGQPKNSSNPNYIPSDAEYNALREVFPWLISAYVGKIANEAVERISK